MTYAVDSAHCCRNRSCVPHIPAYKLDPSLEIDQSTLRATGIIVQRPDMGTTGEQSAYKAGT
jgi:hypothetical protein